MKRILIGACVLAVLLIPACLLLTKPTPTPSAPPPVPTAPQVAQPAPPTGAPSSVAPRPEPIPEAIASTPAPEPAAEPEPRPAAPVSADPLVRLIDTIIPHAAASMRTDDCDIPGDPIGSTLCRMRCHLRDHPDALAERPVVHLPQVAYWHASNLVAHDF